jgi:hypothetical protein
MRQVELQHTDEVKEGVGNGSVNISHVYRDIVGHCPQQETGLPHTLCEAGDNTSNGRRVEPAKSASKDRSREHVVDLF